MRFERSGVTGGIVEEELFGKSNFERITHIDSTDFGYIPYRKVMSMLKDMQPFDPSEPEPDFAYTVHSIVYDSLGIDASDLKFYTAVKSPFDFFHGVDGWFEINKDGKKTLVTVDVTLNFNKEDGHKANIVFLVPNGGLDRKVDKDQFMEYSKNLAGEVIEFFNNQTQ